MYVLRGIIYGIIALFFQPFAVSGEQKSSAQYSIDFVSFHDKEMFAREQIAQEQSQIIQLRKQLAETDQKIEKTVKDQYTILGINELDIERTEQVLTDLYQKIGELNRISTTELTKKKTLIQECNTQLSLLKSSSVGKLRKFSKAILEINNFLLQISDLLNAEINDSDTVPENLSQSEMVGTDLQRAKQPKSIFPSDTYTVKKRPDGSNETLFIIAGYKQIYGDSHQWYRIYRANKKLIDENCRQYKSSADSAKIINPYNLIFPGQVLRIPR